MYAFIYQYLHTVKKKQKAQNGVNCAKPQVSKPRLNTLPNCSFNLLQECKLNLVSLEFSNQH